MLNFVWSCKSISKLILLRKNLLQCKVGMNHIPYAISQWLTKQGRTIIVSWFVLIFNILLVVTFLLLNNSPTNLRNSGTRSYRYSWNWLYTLTRVLTKFKSSRCYWHCVICFAPVWSCIILNYLIDFKIGASNSLTLMITMLELQIKDFEKSSNV